MKALEKLKRRLRQRVAIDEMQMGFIRGKNY